MSLAALPYDAWATIGQYLSPASLSNAGATCSHVHDRIWDNQTLWGLQAANRWKSCSEYGIVDDFVGLYRAGHIAACRLATTNPWCASLPRCPGSETPYSSHLLLKHSSSSYRPPPSTLQPLSTSSRRPSDLLTPPDVVVASLDERLLFWVWDTRPPTPAAGDLGPAPAAPAAIGLTEALQQPAGFGRSVSGGAQRFTSHPQYGHTAMIDVVIEVPASRAAIGVASGARDNTVKLWAPALPKASSSSSSGSEVLLGNGVVRPVKTLRGHTGRITSLAMLHGSSAAAEQSDGDGSSFSVLASGSADRTIRLWDISSLQQQPTTAAGGSAAAQRLARRSANGSAVARSQSYRSQLGMLRGHSDTVTSVMRWDEQTDTGSASGSSGGSSGGHPGRSGLLLSCARDRRVKLWDVAEGRNKALTTWLMPSPAVSLIDALHYTGCCVVTTSDALQVLDVRAPSSGSSVHQGAVTLHWPECHLATAACHGTLLAAGGCMGVRVWDVRMASSNASSSSRGSRSSSAQGRLLFANHMPNREPVSLLHMDRVELVAATSTSAIHSPASIAVWGLPSGDRVQLLSSTLSAVTLHGRNTVMARDELAAARQAAYELMDTMSKQQADKMLARLHEQHLAQQQHSQQAQQQPQQQQPWQQQHLHALLQQVAGPQWQLPQQLPQQQQQQQQQQQGQAPGQGQQQQVGEGPGQGQQQGQHQGQDSGQGQQQQQQGQGQQPGQQGQQQQFQQQPVDEDESRWQQEGDEDDVSVIESWLSREFEDEQDDFVSEDGTEQSWVFGGQQLSMASSIGRIEPGVIALTVSGGIVACVDALGNVLIRDFATGTPKPEQVRPFVAGRRSTTPSAAAAGSAAGSSRMSSSSRENSISSSACSRQNSPGWDETREAAAAPGTAAAAAAASDPIGGREPPLNVSGSPAGAAALQSSAAADITTTATTPAAAGSSSSTAPAATAAARAAAASVGSSPTSPAADPSTSGAGTAAAAPGGEPSTGLDNHVAPAASAAAPSVEAPQGDGQPEQHGH